MPAALQADVSVLPVLETMALDGHTVVLPRDLMAGTILIVGFSRNSADATTAWEIPVRTRLAQDKIGFYDLAVLASVPGLLRGWIVRSLKGKVPPVLHGRFLPVFSNEAEWKKVCGYDPTKPDAAYVLLADNRGNILWATHEPYGSAAFAMLKARAQVLAAAH